MTNKKDLFQQYLDSASVIFLALDESGNVLQANKYVSELLGYDHHDIIGKNWFEHFIPAENRERVLAVWEQIVSGHVKVVAHNENAVVTSSGEERIIAWHNSAIYDDGQFISHVSSGTDITERVKADSDLRRSEQRFRLLIDNLPQKIFLKDRDSNYITCNQNCASDLGITPAEIEGKRDEDLLPIELAEKYQHDDQRVVSGRETIDVEEEFIVDGKKVIIQTVKTPVIADDGEVSGILGIFWDITARKEIESRLANSEQRLIQAQSVGHIGVWDWKPQSGELIWTDEVFHILGFGVNEVEPTYDRFIDCLHPDDRELLNSQVEAALKDNKPYNVDCRIIQPNGCERIANAQGRVYFDEMGQPLQMLGTFQDITERKQIEQTVLDSQKALANAQALAHLGSWEWNLDDDNVIWSDEQFRIFGYEPGAVEPTYQLFADSLHPQDKERILQDVQTARDENQPLDIEYRIIRPDKEIRFVHAKGLAHSNAEGVPLTMMGTVLDITERKRAEEKIHSLESQFYQSQKMEAVGTLVGGIAHDFNNTLAGITGNVFLAKEDFPEVPAGLINHLDIIEQQSFRAAAMIDKLLTFARKSMIAMKPIAISSFIQEVIKLQSVSLPENISFLHEINITDAEIKGDINILQQVLINLINNARDAVQEAENPQVSIHVNAYAPNKPFIDKHPESAAHQYVCISISDNGYGISRKDRVHLFEPFFTTKDVGKGTGLGLAMVYGATQSHHGIIEVDSSEGEGSSFNLFLPLLTDEENNKGNGKAHGSLVSGNAETILVVDDEPMVIDIESRILKRLNYKVLRASNGQEAVDIYKNRNGHINLVILDVVMPVMGGVDAAAAIRKLNPAAKIIFSTGYDHTNTLNNMHDIPSEVVIRKPFKIAEVSQLIHDMLVQ